MSVVLKDFLWSADGFTVETVKVGADLDFGSATDGLVAEGFIGNGPPRGPVVETPVVEPDLLSLVDEPVVEPEPIPEPVVETPVVVAVPAPRKRK